MIKEIIRYSVQRLVALFVFLFFSLSLFAQDKEYPEKPDPPRLVNDYAHLLSDNDNDALERKLEDFANSTSTQITVVTISNLGGHDISEYSSHIFNTWGLGQKDKNNGVLMLVAMDDGYGKRKAWITVGTGLQGVLTDIQAGQIFRNQMVPAFKEKNYYLGLSSAADAIIQVTKGEYTSGNNDRHHESRKSSGAKGIPALVIIVIFFVIIFSIRNRGGGGGGGYRRRSSLGDIATGMIIGSLLGGRGGDSGGSGGGDGGFGGFGGFGGGSTDGGGAGGSW